MNLRFRKGTEKDVPLIFSFIKELAIYEKMLDSVTATEKTLKKTIFDEGYAEVFFAVEDDIEVGFALYFYNYSTFYGKPGLYLEDIFIKEPYRNQGIGKKMFKELARIAQDKGCCKIQWWCLNWNQPSIDFYLKLGAKAENEWTVFRLDETTIHQLAKESS
jgi:GNAT superfamily N-acetyltransferase